MLFENNFTLTIKEFFKYFLFFIATSYLLYMPFKSYLILEIDT